MQIADHYLTITAPVRAAEVKVTGSRFLADLFPLTTKDEAEIYLQQIRKEFYDATHHCYAYRLGASGETMRAADDGEPSGTAGKPILTVLEGHHLTNILCIVTRYFGGTKLGTGGLVRAYTDAARSAVDAAEIKTVYITKELQLMYPFDDISAVERLVSNYECRKISTEYSDSVTLTIAIRMSMEDEFIHTVNDLFHGRLKISRK